MKYPTLHDGRSLSLRQVIRSNPGMFYEQTWYADEDFMDAPLPIDAPTAPPWGVWTIVPTPGMALPLAVELATLYVCDPNAPCWSRYLWTADTDRLGQRIYMGVNACRMEIHRHIHLTERFGIPVWT